MVAFDKLRGCQPHGGRRRMLLQELVKSKGFKAREATALSTPPARTAQAVQFALKPVTSWLKCVFEKGTGLNVMVSREN